MNRRSRMQSTVALLALSVLAACHPSPPVYQPPDRHKKPDPAQAAVANMQMALEYMRENNLARARDRIEIALTEAPSNASVQETAGLVYEKLEEKAKAHQAFTAAARLGKDDPAIQNSYAGYLCRSGKAAAGEKLFLEVARSPLYQTPEVALLNAGVCVGGAGDVLDAERYFNRALTIKPNMPEALLELGNLALSRGDSKEALDYVQRYLAVNPPTPEVLLLGVRADRKLGDSTGAGAFAQQINTQFPDSEQAQMLRSGLAR
ncbi:MAG TPA: type IV pilus biogenesis/stability protein PilW [Steroidobacteraceae bacterium]|jgi:type IV pilus assembly protein PilF|nr:type IV pilus biogenesis/stability protein PilW [Steroidobacteraceae bacterium]